MSLPAFQDDIFVGTPVSLVGEIDEDVADRIVAQLREIDGPIILEIGPSEGGDAQAARRIVREIERRATEVHAEVTTFARSAAALIWLSAPSRSLAHNASVQFHYSHYSPLSVDFADYEVLRRLTDHLWALDMWMARLVCSQTGMTPEAAHELLLADRAVDRAEAFRLGLC